MGHDCRPVLAGELTDHQPSRLVHSPGRYLYAHGVLPQVLSLSEVDSMFRSFAWLLSGSNSKFTHWPPSGIGIIPDRSLIHKVRGGVGRWSQEAMSALPGCKGLDDAPHRSQLRII